MTYRVFGDRIDGTYLGDRLHARAHQHAGGADVGARARRAAGARDVRAAAGQAAGGWRRSCSRRDDPLDLHRAEPAVPDGQPHRVRHLHAAELHGATDGGRGTPTFRIALHHDGDEAELDAFAATSRRSSARQRADLRRVRRASTAAPTRSSPTTCRGPTATAWSTATARSLTSRARCAIRGSAGHARHGGARVLPRLEHGAHPAAVARAVRLRRRRTCRASCGSAEGFTSYFDAADHCIAPG